MQGNNYPNEIRNLISGRRTIGSKWQHSRASDVKTTLKNSKQQLQREIRHIKK